MTALLLPATKSLTSGLARWLSAALIVWLLAWATAVGAAPPKFPPQNGTRVIDAAGLLSKTAEHELDVRLKDFEDATTDQVVVVTVKDLQGLTIESYGYLLGREWGVGQSGQVKAADGSVHKDNGIILLVAPKEREVRIEVGYGLEPVMTDALASMIIRNVIVPEFKAGDYEAGIVKGADAIIAELKVDRAAAVAAYQPGFSEPETARSGNPFGALIVLFMIFCIPGLLLWALAKALGQLFGANQNYYPYQDTYWDTQTYRRPQSSVSSFTSRKPSSSPSRSTYRPSSSSSSSSSSGRSSGGGGFKGGGGSFGGGGASGKW